MSANEIKNHKESRKAINKHLNDLKEGKGITFDQLLNDLNITENDSSRIDMSIPTINELLKFEFVNKIIISAHLGRPESVNYDFSLKNNVLKIKDGEYKED